MDTGKKDTGYEKSTMFSKGSTIFFMLCHSDYAPPPPQTTQNMPRKGYHPVPAYSDEYPTHSYAGEQHMPWEDMYE